MQANNFPQGRPQIAIGSRQLFLELGPCNKVKEAFPQGQVLTKDGFKGQDGQIELWHMRLHLWFKQSSTFEQTSSQENLSKPHLTNFFVFEQKHDDSNSSSHGAHEPGWQGLEQKCFWQFSFLSQIYKKYKI